MKIALCQMNSTVGDVEGNARRILASGRKAHELGARVAVFPELSIPGYPPLDLLERASFVERCRREEDALIRALPKNLVAVFGNVAEKPSSSIAGPALVNAAVVVESGVTPHRFAKSLLPTYDVFDEARYFAPNPEPEANIIEIDGLSLGVTVCEDIWNDPAFWSREDAGRDKVDGAPLSYAIDPVERLAKGGAKVILNLSASPFTLGKPRLRRRLLEHSARRHHVFMLYTNLVGANDGLLFDGSSLAYGPDGEPIAKAARWKEDVVLVDTEARGPCTPADIEDPSDAASIRDALCTGIRDYFDKTGLGLAIIGLSGGVDSAVTAYLATTALGPSRVVGVSMPSAYSSRGSVDDAADLAANLGIDLVTIPIQPVFEAFIGALAPAFSGRPKDITEENLQSRVRGVLLMALANKRSGVVLSTGNKSEAAMGYCTLYGDTVGALAVLGDLYKHQVYAVARLANEDRVLIPESTLEKPPSAELAPGQRDEDSLPPYPVLDRMLELFIEDRLSVDEIATRANLSIDLVRSTVARVHANEFKRRQLPPTLRVSRRSWTGRRYPVVQRFAE